jgi:hypothetical protein
LVAAGFGGEWTARYGCRAHSCIKEDVMFDQELEARVRAMLDREEIRGLTELYCHYVWQKDMRIVDLFSDDGVFTTDPQDPGRAARGREALFAEYRRILEGEAPPLPFIHNHVIEFADDEHATGWCYLDVRTVRDGQRAFGVAFYNDVYVKIAGEWKFAERRVNFVQSTVVPVT